MDASALRAWAPLIGVLGVERASVVSKDPYSPDHLVAIDTVVSALAVAGVWYRATGGLAGNLHGSTWPLHDIDLDYRKADWTKVSRALGPFLVDEPTQYEDEEFRLVMARAQFRSVEIELCQLENCFVAGPNGWQLLESDPARRVSRPWKSGYIWTIPLDDLIAYKDIIGRQSDLKELRSLRHSNAGTSTETDK